MRAASLHEAAAIADKKLAQQNHRDEAEEQVQLRRKKTAAKLAKFPKITMTPAQLKSYDLKKVTKIQRFARSWIMRTRFRQLSHDYRHAQASTESRHRVKALFEFATSEKSYLQSVETALRVRLSLLSISSVLTSLSPFF